MSVPAPVPSDAGAALARLAGIVAEDVLADLRRAGERAINEARRVLLEADDAVAELEQGARAIGAARGAAVEASARAQARREAEVLATRAFDALAERFLTRVRLALESLPGTPRHAQALARWAEEAALRMQSAPADVFVETALRPAVYDALLAAGARDLRVHADPRVHVGFVVRDLDGRTLLDRRPDALVAERRLELLALLHERLGPRPSLPT